MVSGAVDDDGAEDVYDYAHGMSVPAHVVRRLREVLDRDAGDDLVTWMDEASAVRDELSALRRETRADIAELRQEMQAGFARLEASVAAQLATLGKAVTERIANTGSDLMKWSFVFWCGAVAAIAALAGVLRR
jgi:hypothetical protein